jgi:chemotaxis protein methyltransferase CheR
MASDRAMASMNAMLGTSELQLFQSAIAKRLGLRFDDNRLTFLAEVLSRRVEARRVSTGVYLQALLAELEPADELSALARELTVGETYFFRHSDQFAAFSEVALPERLSARASSRALRFLSAGCASGEEAYSLAILTRERAVEPAFNVSVLGLDVNPDALAKARAGLYTPWSLRETPSELRERYFTREGGNFRLLRLLRDKVRFEQHNLIEDAAQLVAGAFDVVFCRNVLMYFTTEQALGIVERLTRALAPGGFLFLGHAETLRGLSHAFHLRHTHRTFYYQKRDEPDRVEPEVEDTGGASQSGGPGQRGADDAWVGPWLETVARSSRRIRELSTSQASPAPLTPDASAAPRPALDLSAPMELLKNERYADALAALSLPASHAPDSTALLLRAALLTHQGDVAQAERVCHELLRFDDLNAGAHYLLALCCERREEPSIAIEHDRTAVYLDSGFAMPHLHLGLMARRRRDAETARHELTLALTLLEREEPSRLLLFGGGFSRAALLALCRTELSNLRGSST